jgi:SanA protein
MRLFRKPFKSNFTRKFFLRFSLFLFGSPLLLLIWANIKVEIASDAYVTSDIDKLPNVKVGIVPGTKKMLGSGYVNQYFQFRIDAAVKLYEAGKVKHFLVSGDNSREDYNEAEDMKVSLVEAGIPDSIITLDYAGFDTYDSMIRAREVFGQDRFIVISQEFQNERAVYIARSFGIEAFGYNAQNVNSYGGLKTKGREFFARGKAFVEVLFGVQPTYLGEKVLIP